MFKHLFVRNLLLFSLFSLLSACNENTDDQPTPPLPAMTGAEMVLSSAGVGPINAQTAFNIHTITLAFQDRNYHVEQIQKYTDGQSYPSIRISKDTDTLLIITPDASQQGIFSVLIKDRRVGNVLGHPIGMEYGAIYAYGHTEQCTLGSTNFSGKVLCYAPRSGNIIYLFGNRRPQPYAGTKLPPIDALDSWRLESIIWKPNK